MPIGTRETLLILGTAIGVAVTGSVNAEPSETLGAKMILAQNQQQEEDQRERRRERRQEGRRERGQEQEGRQERRERAQERRQQQEGRQERRERAQERRQQQEGRQERRERAQERRQQQEGRQERRERAQEEQRREKQERQEAPPQERRERAQEEQQREKRQERRRERAQEEQQREKRQERRERAQEEQQREKRQERRERAQEEQQREKRQERRERVEERRDQRQDRREDRRERARDRGEDREITREERRERREQRREFSRERLGDIKRGRRERRLEGGRVVIEEPGNRRIIRDRGRVIIEHDETERLRGRSRNVRIEDGPRGRKRTIITRPNGVEIITVEDRRGRLLRRVKRLPNGRRIVLFNNEYEGRGRRGYRDDDDDYGVNFYIDLPEFTASIPEEEYYVYADRADEDEIEEVLTAPPLRDLEDDYTLNEIRYSPDIRKRLRKLNFNTINFASGSWEIEENQIGTLEVVARVINRILDKNPEEVFLIGGHTDAVGSDEDNLSLSDRRAETVARVLTDEFSVPPENLVTQGYGEANLLIETADAEGRNRRVEFMRITPFLARKEE